MKICFINYLMDFNVDTPYFAPLGGTESAIAYLCVEMARLGHQVVLLSPTSSPGTHRGVLCLNLALETAEFFASQHFDTVIISNAAMRAPYLRSILPAGTKIILWVSHDRDQPAVQSLMDKNLLAQWDLFVMISEYQRTGFINRFSLPKNRCEVLRYGVSPFFQDLFTDFETFCQAKKEPILVYTSTPFRGLNLLPEIFRNFHHQFPETRLKIFSSMKVYQTEDQPEAEKLYQELSGMDGIEYVGSLPQQELSGELFKSLILAYPNTFAETACIAVMEAMAAGCFVVTSELGALPETCDSYAELIPVAFKSIPEYMNLYYHSLVSIYQEMQRNRPAMLEHLWNQVNFVNREYAWTARAREWESALEQLLAN